MKFNLMLRKYIYSTNVKLYFSCHICCEDVNLYTDYVYWGRILCKGYIREDLAQFKSNFPHRN